MIKLKMLNLTALNSNGRLQAKQSSCVTTTSASTAQMEVQSRKLRLTHNLAMVEKVNIGISFNSNLKTSTNLKTTSNLKIFTGKRYRSSNSIAKCNWMFNGEVQAKVRHFISGHQTECHHRSSKCNLIALFCPVFPIL